MRNEERSWASLSKQYGGAGQGLSWEPAFRAYESDDMEEAHRRALQLGVGGSLFRMIDAEWISRQNATLFEAEGKLKVEIDARFEPVVAEFLLLVLKQAKDAVQARLAVAECPPILLTILIPEANAPWTPGRHGFCIGKREMYKVCLPAYLLQDEPELDIALRHEVSHAVSGAVTEARIPVWLDEAIAMRMGGSVSDDYEDDLLDGETQWADPSDLESWFGVDREASDSAGKIRSAYQQARVIADYLVSVGGEVSLGQTLLAFSNNSMLQELKMQIVGQSGADEALREVYGLSEREGFERAYRWLRDGGRTQD